MRRFWQLFSLLHPNLPSDWFLQVIQKDALFQNVQQSLFLHFYLSCEHHRTVLFDLAFEPEGHLFEDGQLRFLGENLFFQLIFPDV